MHAYTHTHTVKCFPPSQLRLPMSNVDIFQQKRREKIEKEREKESEKKKKKERRKE